MQSIFQKLRVITLSNIHTLLDAVKGLNSIGEFEQYIRDLETARNMLDDQAASARSDVNTLPTEIATLRAKHKEADDNIMVLLQSKDDNNIRLAAPLEAQLINLEQQIKLKEEQLAASQDQLVKFDDAVAKLDTTLVGAKGKLETLRLQDATTKGKERAEAALSGIAISEMPDIDNVEAKMRRRAAVADNALDRTLGKITESAGGNAIDSTVAARLAKRQQALAAGSK